MFSRNFMKTFANRKYAQITAKSGSVISDQWLISSTEIRFTRPIVYFMVAGIMLLAFDNFHTVDELIGRTTRPISYTIYEKIIPKEVLNPNISIISDFEALAKAKELHKTLTLEQ